MRVAPRASVPTGMRLRVSTKFTLRSRGSKQERQRVLAPRLDFQLKQRVGAGSSEIDRGDWLAAGCRALCEAIAGVDHQRRADDQHGVGRIEMSARPLDLLARHVLAEEDDVRLHHPAAVGARRHSEGGKVSRFEIGVAVRRVCRLEREPARVAAGEFALEVRPRRKRAAAHAADPIEPPVQVDHPLAPCRLMQPVHVLGQEMVRLAQLFEPGQRAVGGVRLSCMKTAPADQASRPIAAARGLARHEGLIGHRLGPLPLTVGVAIVRNPRIRAASRPGEHDQPPMPADEIFESAEPSHAEKVGWRPCERQRRRPALRLHLLDRLEVHLGDLDHRLGPRGDAEFAQHL